MFAGSARFTSSVVSFYLASSAAELGEWLEPIPSCYGMHVRRGAHSWTSKHVPEALLRHNVKMHTFSRYFVGPQTEPSDFRVWGGRPVGNEARSSA